MDEILQFLKSANKNFVTLFFTTRKKDPITKEITYRVLKSKIKSDIGEDLRSSGIIQIESLLKKEPEDIEYGILSGFDRLTIEKINADEVPCLYEILQSIANPDLDLVTNKDLEHIWGYIVRIESLSKTLFLFKRYTPKKLLEKGKIACSMQDGHFEKFNNQIIAIDSSYDAALLIEKSSAKTDSASSPTVFILSRSSFESLFSFVEIYISEVEANKKYVIDKSLLNDPTAFIENCINDTRKLRKLARIISKDQLQSLNIEKIKTVISDYNLDINIDKAGKLEFDSEKIWVILRIFDDDYVKSEITDNKYEARSKVKK